MNRIGRALDDLRRGSASITVTDEARVRRLSHLIEEVADGSDLQIAQIRRPEAMDLFKTGLDLVQGKDLEVPLGGGTRCWRNR